MQSFNDLPLPSALMRAVTDLGYEKPSPIQAEALPILLEQDVDFVGLAATGTGKTAAFGLPLLAKLKPGRHVQALVLCPTRELCLQVAGQIDLLGRHLGVRTLAIYGGSSYEEQFAGLKRGTSVVVGTPGRVIDHLERGTLDLSKVGTVVLDEADEMISMGFREAMEEVLESLPENRRVWLFSATMSPSVRQVADRFLVEPARVEVNRTEMLSSTVEQYYYATHEKNKPEVLCKLIDAAEDFYGVIFCQTKTLVVDLTRYLQDRGYKVDSLHGDMSQSAREASMLAFRERRTHILVCTDVAARGLDVKDVTHVINYSLPRELDSYVHRIGRTARSGKTGIAMSLVTPSHRHLIGKIERLTKSRMHEGQIPSRKAIGMKKIARLLTQFSDQPGYERAVELMDPAWKDALKNMSAEEVAGRFMSMMYPWVFSEKERPQMERTDKKPETRSSRDEKQARRDQKRQEKREFKKKFIKGFQARKARDGGYQPPRRRV